MQRSRRSGFLFRRTSAAVLAASLVTATRLSGAETSPAVPTTQEVPPPTPAVEPTAPPELPSSTEPPPAAPAEGTSEPPAESASSAPAPPPTPAAQPTSTPAPAARPAAMALDVPAERPGVHQHDGFFVRISSGFGSWSERLSSEDSSVYGGVIDGRSSGITSAGDLSIGGTIGRGKVLALSFAGTDLLASTFRQTDRSVGAPPSEIDPGLRRLLVAGPTFIWYPDDRGGFMAEGGLGLALLTPSDASTSNRSDGETYGAGGLALSLAIGQQFFFANQFSIGVRGRLILAAASGEDQEGVRWVHAMSAGPAVLCDVVYH